VGSKEIKRKEGGSFVRGRSVCVNNWYGMVMRRSDSIALIYARKGWEGSENGR